jgi:hypothetical protein
MLWYNNFQELDPLVQNLLWNTNKMKQPKRLSFPYTSEPV